MTKRLEKITQITEGSFLGITPPELELFDVKLTQKSEIVKKVKTGEEQAKSNDYTIAINRSKLTKDTHQQIASNLQQIFGMSWISFEWSTQTFNYYTNKYTGDDNFKKQQLQNIFEFLKDFESEYKKNSYSAIVEFDNDKKNFESYKDDEIVVKYNEQLDAVVVLAISYLGREKYLLLANASKEKGYFSNANLDKEFFADLYSDKNIDRKMFFIINSFAYKNVKNLIEKKKEEKNNYISKQESYIAENQNNFIEYTEKNLFDFKIMFHKERNGFEFFCKGYNEPTPSMYGNYTERSILGRWALNFILSEEVSQENIQLSPTWSASNDIELDKHYRLELDIQKDSSLRDKCIFVPADNFDTLKKFYDKFLTINEFFSRPQKTIKINNADFLYRTSRMSGRDVNLSAYPAIYLDSKGNATFIYQYRSFTERVTYEKDEVTVKKVAPPNITMKGVAISFTEMNEFFTTHPFAKQIKNNSIFLNTEIWMRDGQNIDITEEERLSAFENIYMHAKITQEAKEVKKSKVHKI